MKAAGREGDNEGEGERGRKGGVRSEGEKRRLNDGVSSLVAFFF